MQIVKLYPVLVISNLAFFSWFYVAYRFHKKEMADGDTSFPQILWMLIMPGGLLAYFWKYGWESPLTSWLDFFVAAQVGLGFSVAALYAIQQLFMTEGLPKSQKAMSGFFLVFFAVLFGSIIFTSRP